MHYDNAFSVLIVLLLSNLQTVLQIIIFYLIHIVYPPHMGAIA